MTIREASEALRSRRFSSVELTSAAAIRIERSQATLNAFITVTAERAMKQAQQADAELAAGRDRGPLHGIPMAVKDLFLTRGIRTTGGSKVYENFVPNHDAAVVERLEAAGAVMLGKLNMHELAYGITSANPHFGAVRNPWNVAHSPGGSSGGSGAAVAAGLVYAAMGSDTGGSIRIPASFCGTVGLKPTYGRVSRYGVLPLGYSLDHMGPLTRTVRDAAIVLNAIAGYDRRDETSSRRPVIDYVPDDGCSVRGVRIGFPENFYFERLDGDVEASVRGAVARAGSLGAVVKSVRVPDIAALNTVARVILLAEASAMMEPCLEPRQSFGSDVRALLDQGRLLPATDYVNAQRLRRRFRREFEKVWAEVDCLFLPTTPNTAPGIGEKTVRLAGQDEDVRLATTRLVRGINALGYPALSMPCGLSGTGLPIGLQIVGPAFEEALILRIGAALEDGGVGIPPCPAV
ncbi:MAG: Asp-tRNA(Asn)/Glu-tRNA(Gln) amidotransferase GatCAB subunit A [Acidobacteriia bacterium]|nr:Asp-tRNA(Asn)/Glu-tRNA(Gln) amidotransferase GatCAB subunit A [Terriglobia bacterium]